PESVQPQVALYLARGQTALAAARLHRRLNQLGRENLLSAPLLAQLVEVQLAQGDRANASLTADSLAAIARRFRGQRFEAEAELAIGGVGAATEDPQAPERLGRAIDLFTRGNLPHGAARAHLALARAVHREEPERAVDEARQALAGF